MTQNLIPGKVDTDGGWVRTWGNSPQSPQASVAALESFADATLRQVVRVSGGGTQVRVRFTNEYGTTPLTVGSAHLALAASGGDIQAATDHALTFNGRSDAVIPAGAAIDSDVVGLEIVPLSHLVISLYLPEQVEICTSHGGMDVQGWMIPGNVVAAVALPRMALPLPARGLLAAVDVLPTGPARAVAVIGDSLTDGVGSTPHADRDWLSLLTERLIERGGAGGYVSNQGISGNRLLQGGFGESALERFDRDVLATPGLGYVIVVEGLNDIAMSYAPADSGPEAEFMKMLAGEPITPADLIQGYRDLVDRAHRRGLRIYAATLTPYEGADVFSAEGEQARQAVNTWIRQSGVFDAVLDFDAVWADPARPTRIREGYQAGDHLHGSDAGYKAMADSIDLDLFR